MPEYYTYMEYQYSTGCNGYAQRTSGTRFGACITSNSGSWRYGLISWNESTSFMKFNVTTYTYADCVEPIGVEVYTSDSGCSLTMDSYDNKFGYKYTYSTGVTPWVEAIAPGGSGSLYWYPTDSSTECSGPADKYYMQAYDYCQQTTYSISMGPVACSETSYTEMYYSDNQCSYPSYTNTIPKTTCIRTYPYELRSDICGLSSENFAVDDSDDDTDYGAVLLGAGLSLTAIILSIFAGAMLIYARFGPRASLYRRGVNEAGPAKRGLAAQR